MRLSSAPRKALIAFCRPAAVSAGKVPAATPVPAASAHRACAPWARRAAGEPAASARRAVAARAEPRAWARPAQRARLAAWPRVARPVVRRLRRGPIRGRRRRRLRRGVLLRHGLLLRRRRPRVALRRHWRHRGHGGRAGLGRRLQWRHFHAHRRGWRQGRHLHPHRRGGRQRRNFHAHRRGGRGRRHHARLVLVFRQCRRGIGRLVGGDRARRRRIGRRRHDGGRLLLIGRVMRGRLRRLLRRVLLRRLLRLSGGLVEGAVHGRQHLDAAVDAAVRHDQRVRPQHLAHLAHHVTAVQPEKRLIFMPRYLRR